MDYRYLKAFLSTAKHVSFSKAAEELNIAQSAVSRQIKLLEESLNEELIIRSSKQVLLTFKGQQLYLAAQRFDQISADIFEREETKTLNIGILNGLLSNWFTPLLIKYSKKYDRSIDIHIDDQPQLKKGIEEGKFDIIFSTDNIQSDLISSLKLFDEKLILISKKEINRKKLHEHKWIVFSDTDNLYRVSKKISEKIIHVDSIDTILNLVNAGVGIAVVPDHVLKSTKGLNIYDIPSINKSEIFMITLNYKKMPTYIKEMADIITS
jgi:DNA-binding transcriptional LysR family regulator